mmetsp:Transcript_81019/g.224119  ORF Transcript_81019/g.224119 Transcript_81019/m.224119 type:complete len:213 (-) Transcript_81019:91-729(-)
MMLMESLGIASCMRSPLRMLRTQGREFPETGPGLSCGPKMRFGFMMHSRGEAAARAGSATALRWSRPTSRSAANSMRVFAAGDQRPLAFWTSGSLQCSTSFFAVPAFSPGGLVLPPLLVTTTHPTPALRAARMQATTLFTMKSMVSGSWRSKPAQKNAASVPARRSSKPSCAVSSTLKCTRCRESAEPPPAWAERSDSQAAFSGSREAPFTW